jgi:hypothetical protein
MMKLVVFAATACAAVEPMAQLKEQGVVGDWTAVMIWAAVAAPLACAVTAFPVIRRGPFRDWLIRVFLLASVSAALGFAFYIVGWHVLLVTLRGRHLYAFSSLEGLAIIAALGLAFIFLLRRVVPGWCPECKLPILLSFLFLSGAEKTLCGVRRLAAALPRQAEIRYPIGGRRVLRSNAGSRRTHGRARLRP